MSIETSSTQLATTASATNAVALRRQKYWLAAREAGKLSRLNLTDAIKLFVEYKDKHGGSTRPDLAYANFTRSIYAPFGLNRKEAQERLDGRDDYDLTTLSALATVEGVAADVIREGIAKGALRREIKQAVKEFAKHEASLIRGVKTGKIWDATT